MYYEELAHAIMKTKKPHDLPFASCRPINPVVQFQSEPKCLRNKGSNGINPNPRAGEGTDGPAQAERQNGKKDQFFHFLFYSGPQKLDDTHPYDRRQPT